jgi:hypothetical protein
LGDNISIQSFNEIFKGYEAKTGKKVEVTYYSISELDARLASNPRDISAFLHRLWATVDPTESSKQNIDNHLYPDWNPSAVVDNLPVA